MIETLLFTLLFAKIRKYKLKPLFKDWAIYPVIIFTFIYIVLEIKIFSGNYNVLQYAKVYKMAHFAAFFILILRYNLYIYGFISSLLILLGSYLNTIVMSANGGKMPVFPTLTLWTGYIKDVKDISLDGLHILGDSSTKLKFLSDIFDVGYSVMSIGDIIIRGFAFVIIYNAIKQINSNLSSNSILK